MKDGKMKGWGLTVLFWLPVIISGAAAAGMIFLMAAGRNQGPEQGPLYQIIFLAAAFFLLILSIAAIVIGKKKVSREITEYAKGLGTSFQEAALQTELPYAIIKEDGQFLWMNQCFRERSGASENLLQMFPELAPEEIVERSDPEDELYLSQEGRTYRVRIRTLDAVREVLSEEEEGIFGEEGILYAVFLYDETARLEAEEKLENEKMVAGIIYLDNYDEVLDAIDDVHRSLLIAMVDRRISTYFQEMGGIVRKTEVDKYFIVIRQQCVEELMKDQFGILEDVKKVSFGNSIAVTVSIGMGMNGQTFEESFAFARTAIDMALARGGDQAVLKDGDSIRYFGGKSIQSEKTTRVKARVKANALRELAENKEKIFVMGHKLGDIDCFGAAIGVYRCMTALNKKTQIVINDVTTSVRPLMDEFTGSNSYPKDLFITGEEAEELITPGSLLVIVDVNRTTIVEQETLLSKAETVVVLDHHRQTSESITQAVLSYVEPYASSACEMVAEILQYISQEARLTPMEANAMYAGIVLDTNNFTTQTGVRTFEAAAFLKRSGADIIKVRKLFRDNINDYKAKAAAVHNAEVFCDSFAISICPAEDSESPTIVGAQAANELLNIIGIKASIVLTEYKGKIYVSARSIDEVNVQMMMERLGGGGHISTAGAQLTGCTVEQAKELVKETVKQMLEEGYL